MRTIPSISLFWWSRFSLGNCNDLQDLRSLRHFCFGESPSRKCSGHLNIPGRPQFIEYSWKYQGLQCALGESEATVSGLPGPVVQAINRNTQSIAAGIEWLIAGATAVGLLHETSLKPWRDSLRRSLPLSFSRSRTQGFDSTCCRNVVSQERAMAPLGISVTSRRRGRR